MDEKLFLAIVAASSAICGVLITQAFTLIRDIFSSRKEKQNLLREKYELLTLMMGESFLHRVKIANHTSDEFHSDYLNRPLEKIYCLSILYFPGLVEPTRDYLNAYRDFYNMLAETFIPDIHLSSSMQNVKEADSKSDVIIEKLNDAEQMLYKAIRENAPKYV